MASLTIAVIGGTGNVGSTLAHRLVHAGHHLIVASRDPKAAKAIEAVEKIKAHAAHGGTVKAAGDHDAVKEASVIIIAVPSPTTEGAIIETANALGPVTGKLIIDATNPGTFGATGFRLATAANGGSFASAGEVFAKALPGATVVKAFNTLGQAHMANPSAHGKRLQLLWAGPHDPTAERVIHDVGFEPVYAGPISSSRNLESMAELWINGAYVHKVAPLAGGKFVWGVTTTD